MGCYFQDNSQDNEEFQTYSRVFTLLKAYLSRSEKETYRHLSLKTYSSYFVVCDIIELMSSDWIVAMEMSSAHWDDLTSDDMFRLAQHKNLRIKIHFTY